MRARYPDSDGYVDRQGVNIFYEVYGNGDPTVLLLPTWSVVHSRSWKMQIPYLARHFRVVVFDPRGNGKSDRPTDPEAYLEEQFAEDALAVLNATGTKHAVAVSLSRGAERSLILGTNHPDRVSGMVFIAPALPLPPTVPRPQAAEEFMQPHDEYEGWGKWNRNYWMTEYEGFLEWFFAQVFSEPHSTKQREDAVGWGLETDAETMVASQLAPRLLDEPSVRELTDRVTCEVLVIHGGADTVRPPESCAALAGLTGGDLITLEGSGHNPQARDPVKVNRAIKAFVDQTEGAINA